MESESPAPAAAQIETLQQENARLRAQLAAMQQLALAPREPMNLAQRRWVGRSIQLLLVLFGVLGGLLAFGLVGLFAGPIVLAVAWAVWREWAAHLDEDAADESP